MRAAVEVFGERKKVHPRACGGYGRLLEVAADRADFPAFPQWAIDAGRAGESQAERLDAPFSAESEAEWRCRQARTGSIFFHRMFRKVLINIGIHRF
jgi:hypothetical protein